MLPQVFSTNGSWSVAGGHSAKVTTGSKSGQRGKKMKKSLVAGGIWLERQQEGKTGDGADVLKTGRVREGRCPVLLGPTKGNLNLAFI